MTVSDKNLTRQRNQRFRTDTPEPCYSVAPHNKKKIYDCSTCSYPRYKDGSIIFCDVCIRRILDEQKEKKQGKENADGERG